MYGVYRALFDALDARATWQHAKSAKEKQKSTRGTMWNAVALAAYFLLFFFCFLRRRGPRAPEDNATANYDDDDDDDGPMENGRHLYI